MSGVKKVTDIIDQYEIPKEYHKAMFEAYEAGGQRLTEIHIEREIARLNEKYAPKTNKGLEK